MDSDLDPKPCEQKVHLEVKPHPTNKRQNFLPIIRYSAFFVMEACFIALAFYCYFAPRRLPLGPLQNVDPATVRSGYQTIFNTWNNIAIALAASICREAFSKEWAARRDSPTDAVSKVTSGIIDQALYFFTSRATQTYRVAFPASIILILMQSISSSTIPVTSGVSFHKEIAIGLLSSVNISADLTKPNEQGFVEGLWRAGPVVRLEKLGGSPWGLSPPSNWLIPLPLAVGNITSRVDYGSDLVQFRHSCTWRSPSLDSANNKTFILDGQKWILELIDYGVREEQSRTGPGSSIQQLWPPDPVEDLNGTSVYLFLGGNSTFPVKMALSNDTWIDLSTLPSLYNPSQFTAYHPISLDIDWVASPLATLLVCKAEFSLTTGSVSIVPSTGFSLKSDLQVSHDGEVPSLKNIDPSAVNVLFSLSLYFASNDPDEILSEQAIAHINFNSILSKMFMPKPPSGSWRNSSAVPPKPLSSMSSSVDEYKLSALKAFTTGYKPESDIAPVEGVFSTTVGADIVDDTLTLSTSHPYAVVHAVLATVEAILLVILVVLNQEQNRLPFELANVKEE